MPLAPAQELAVSSAGKVLILEEQFHLPYGYTTECSNIMALGFIMCRDKPLLYQILKNFKAVRVFIEGVNYFRGSPLLLAS